MYNLLDDPFYPCLDEKGKRLQYSLRQILLGEIPLTKVVGRGDPSHPDPAIEAFLRYLPSLVLQVLEVDLNENEWKGLVEHGVVESDFLEDYRKKLQIKMEEKRDFFSLYPDQSGFYQHYEIKKDLLKNKKQIVHKKVMGMDGLLVHASTGNNHCHHTAPQQFQQMCISCALTSLIHHNYFCTAGLAGPSNLRGNQAYLCMIYREDYFTRMICNTYFFHKSAKDYTMKQGWEPQSSQHLPSWKKKGKSRESKGYEDTPKEMNLLRTILYAPRHAFFELEEGKQPCDFCGVINSISVKEYYWRVGESLKEYYSHPTLARTLKKFEENIMDEETI